MAMLQAMHVNSIRQYIGIPPRWITYIYDTYGIFTTVNHTAGRYGFNIAGTWVPANKLRRPRDARHHCGRRSEVRENVPRYSRGVDVAAWQRKQLRVGMAVL